MEREWELEGGESECIEQISRAGREDRWERSDGKRGKGIGDAGESFAPTIEGAFDIEGYRGYKLWDLRADLKYIASWNRPTFEILHSTPIINDICYYFCLRYLQ